MQLLASILRSWRRNALRTLVVDDLRSWRGLHLQAATWQIADLVDRQSKAPHVASLLPTCGLFPATAAATWTLGRSIVPLNFLLSASEIAYILDDCGADTLVTVSPMLKMIGELPAGIKPILLDKASMGGIPPIRRSVRRDDDALAALLYTSGTSGQPKGVMLSAGNLASNIEQCRTWVGFSRSDRFLGILPQFHSFGFTVTTLLPAVLGAPVIYSARFSPRRTIELIRTHRPTAMLAIPSMYNAMLQAKRAEPSDFASVRCAVSGGEALPDAVYEGFKDRFGITINEGYGLTETSPVANLCRPSEHRRGTVGRAVDGVEQRIVDEDGAVLGPNEDGEVRIKGPNVMAGYFNLPDETDAAFDVDGYFRTGDMGRLDEGGFLSITGRIKEMLIIGGENVFPREIESALEAHSSVSAAGVVGRPDASRGEVAVGFVELVEGAEFDEKALRTFCRDRLASFKVPREIRHLEEMPRNPTGKLMRRALAAILEEDA